MVLVVLLTVNPDEVGKFHAYEQQAARVMARHGGSIERVVEIPAEAPGDPYREVHIVSFPDAEGYEAYKADPEMANWKSLRDASVIRTETLKGNEGPGGA